MTDICSVWAYEEIKKSGYVGKNQARYLFIFASYKYPLTHYEATKKVEEAFYCEMPERNGRIAELEAAGFIEKVDIVICQKSNKSVNRWKYTGRKTPLPTKEVWGTCEHCNGSGNVKKTIYVKEDERQLALL